METPKEMRELTQMQQWELRRAAWDKHFGGQLPGSFLTCFTCGALIGNGPAHIEWHDRQPEAPIQHNRGPEGFLQ